MNIKPSRAILTFKVCGCTNREEKIKSTLFKIKNKGVFKWQFE